jgi:hypothetical protein
MSIVNSFAIHDYPFSPNCKQDKMEIDIDNYKLQTTTVILQLVNH